MDFETLLLILFLLLPLLSRLFGKKQPPRSAPTYEDDDVQGYDAHPMRSEPVSQGGRREDEDSLSEALRQIREALGEPSPAPAPPQQLPEPQPVRQRPVRQQPIPQQSIPQRSIPQRSIPQRSVPASSSVPKRGSIPHKAMTRSRLENTAKAPLPRSIDPGVPLEVETGPGSAFRANDLAARLRQEGAVREAVLMKEILDRPLSMRGGRR